MEDTDDLLLLTIVVALGFFFAVAFYESLSTRDVLIARIQRWSRRLSARPVVTAATYGLTVFIGIPVLVALWSTVLAIILIFVGSVDMISDVGLIAVVVVGAARILAYVREKTSHELAKAIPLALGFLLLTGGALDLEAKIERIEQNDGTQVTPAMLTFLIVLEVALRLMSDATNWLMRSYRQRHGIKSDAGFWATLAHVIKRTFGTGVQAATADVTAPGSHERLG